MDSNMAKIKSKFKSNCLLNERSCLNKGDRVVLIDDVLATGGTLNAAIQLMRQAEAEVVHILLVNRVQCLNGIKNLTVH